MAKFKGFNSSTFKFLSELEKNNNRPWFAENKHRYENVVLDPSLDFIVDMASQLEKLSADIEAVPKRVGGSLMRVYRDTRFGKDKTPYKTNIGIHFRHRMGKDVHCPAFHCHISNTDVFLGAGIWRPNSKTLAAIRRRIDQEPKQWIKVRDNRQLNKIYSLSGDCLKRNPRGFSLDHPLIEDLKRKDFIAICHLHRDEVKHPAFIKRAAAIYKAANPLMEFLCKAIEVPY